MIKSLRMSNQVTASAEQTDSELRDVLSSGFERGGIQAGTTREIRALASESAHADWLLNQT